MLKQSNIYRDTASVVFCSKFERGPFGGSTPWARFFTAWFSMKIDLIDKNYNSQALVQMWRDFIDWDKRRIGENNFLVDQFRKHNVKKVFDAALGDGCDSIYLIKQGFDVVSNEIDETFLNKALENADKENVSLKITTLDWRKLDTGLPEKSFDAVILLGNSLTYLFSSKAQAEALSQFRRILKKEGVLIIDERNCQYILDNKEEILKGKFHYSGKYVYCGDKVHGKPIEITNDEVKFEYVDEVSAKKAYLTLYPFKRGEMKKLLTVAGFKSIKQFSDYKEGQKFDADFYQYICKK